MLLEFCGPQGAGKSAVYRALTAAARGNHVPFIDGRAATRSARAKWNARGLLLAASLRHSAYVSLCARLADHDRLRFAASAGKIAFDFSVASSLVGRGNLVFCEELVGQKFVGLAMRSDAQLDSLAARYARVMPRSDVLVHVDCDFGTAVECMRHRQTGVAKYLDNKSAADVERLWRRAQAASRLLCEHANRMGTEVIHCDRSGSAADNATEILSRISSIRRSSTAPDENNVVQYAVSGNNHGR